MAWLDIFVLVVFFVGLLLLGVPISFSIGLATLITMLMSIPFLPALTTVSQRIATGVDSFALLAIPFFILAGQLMNRGGIARRLIDFAKVIVGRLPGGLAYVNIMACMLFGAISGSAVAAVAAIGSFMVPMMVAEKYDREFSASVNVTSATTGLIIPPSNVIIVYSLASGGASIAALFLAGYIPGILIGLALMFVSGMFARRHRYPTGEQITLKDSLRRFFDALPSLSLLIVVMGGIVTGIFTATEASAVAVLYTLILSVLVYKEVKWTELPKILLDSSVTTAIVMLLVGTSMGMSWIMSYENIPQGISAALIALTDNRIVILLIINLLLLLVGTFMDITPAILIFTPIFLPVVIQLGLHPVHFGIIMVMNLCIGCCTPPVGNVLFIGCSVAETSITKMIRPLLPLFIAMIFTLILVTYLPVLSLWLPGLFGFK